MPTAATTMVTSTPPHCEVETRDSPMAGKPSSSNDRRKRHHDEEVERAEVAPRRVEPRHPADAEGEQREEHIDPPALFDRIEAVGEEIDAVDDEGPAGADLRAIRPRQAVGPARAVPHRVDDQELRERRHDPDDQQGADQGQHDVERAGEQVIPEPSRPRRTAPAAAAWPGSAWCGRRLWQRSPSSAPPRRRCGCRDSSAPT